MRDDDPLSTHLSALFLGVESLLEIEIDRTNDEMTRGAKDRSASPGSNRYVQLAERRHRLETVLDNLRHSVTDVPSEKG